MQRKNSFLLIACCLVVVLVPGAYAQKNPTAEQLVENHLKSIGERDAISRISSISLNGTAEINFIQGMNARLAGASTLVSEGSKLGIVLRIGHHSYSGDHFAYDGKSVTVENFDIGMKSPLAEFINSYNKIIKNGMLGGVFSRAWQLFDTKGNRPRSMTVRKNKVEGTELYELEYRPRDDHGDMKIFLYFETETYRHVRTDYKVKNNSIAALEIYDNLTEKFEDFREVGELTLPHGYTLIFQKDGDQPTFLGHWIIKAQEIAFDAPDIDTKIFKIE